jgi:hypothetical protein
MRILVTASVIWISALLAGCAQTEQPSGVTIRALQATGQTFFTPSPQPIWRFAITNSSQSEVCWQSGIETSGDRDHGYSRAGGFIEWPTGTLAPSQGIETNMIVPAKSGISWRAQVEFRPLTRQESEKYKAEAAKFYSSVFELAPYDKKRAIYHDGWHH